MAPLINYINSNQYHTIAIPTPIEKTNTKPNKTISKNPTQTNTKVASFIGSGIGTLIYLFALAKFNKGKNFKPKDLLNINFKNMFKVMGLATASVIGGLTGGMLTDKKENQKAKIKEAIHQFLGNIITPITIVGIACKIIEKKKMSQTKEILMSGLSAIIGVATGVTGGNFVASKINEKIFKENDNRKLTIKDFGIHIDDLLTVAALSPSIGDKITKFTSKALPLIFLICGYEAGTKTEADITQNLTKLK